MFHQINLNWNVKRFLEIQKQNSLLSQNNDSKKLRIESSLKTT